MYSINDILEVIEDEDLSYAVLEGISPSKIKDPELSVLWEEARDVLIRIQEHLDQHGDEDEDEWEDDWDEDDE